MSYKNILKRHFRADEQYFLMKEEMGDEDDFGFSTKEFKVAQEIFGVIQEPQLQEIDFKGEESNPAYVGYFLPDFILKTNEIGAYRLKFQRPHETLILKIKDYDPNLFIRGKRDHIQMTLILDKKV